MPNLKMLTGLSGPDFSLSRNDEREFDEAEASRLIRAGFAVATDGFVPIALEDEAAEIEPDAHAAAKAAEEASAAKADEEAAAAEKAKAEAAAAAKPAAAKAKG